MSVKGAKNIKAANLLVSLLSKGEMPSAEVYRIAQARGISNRILERAKPMVGLRSRCIYFPVGKAWYMSVPEEMKGRVFGEPPSESRESKLPVDRIISSDWAKIVIDEEAPSVAEGEAGSLHIKVGTYEFTADKGFPMEKLAELLHGLDTKDSLQGDVL